MNPMVTDSALALPREPSGERNRICEPTTLQDEIEKPSKANSTSSLSQHDLDGMDRDTEITYHYLTFETELPSPTCFPRPLRPMQPIEGRTPPPECPNLKKYTSPFLWSGRRKAFITWLSCTATAFTAFTAGSYSAGYDQMTREWHVSEVALDVGITTFTCGFGIAPMFLAPFSEINGRRPVFVVTGILFVIFQLVCAVTPTYAGMLVARFLTGCASSTFSTMVGGVVSDIYHARDRNTAMALFTGAALLGTGLGPLISGPIAYHISWRWIFWLQVIVDGLLILFVVIFFQETRGSVLLSRKARALNKWYEQLEAAGYYGVRMESTSDDQKCTTQRIRWKVKADEERASVLQMIRISLYRPFHMLISEPVVFFFSLWVSFSWAVLYMTFSAIPLIFETTYNFNLQQATSVFAAIAIGSIIFTTVTINQEKLARRYFPHRIALLDSPEGRLVFACVESALLPIGCIWFCVSGAYPSVPWIVPALGIACATMGIFSIYLCVFNFLADTYHRYASSALAAQSFCRNIVGGVFPLFTAQMFDRMTYQGAGGFLGGVGFLLTLVPWVLLAFGPKIRAKSKLASEVLGKD